MSETITAYRSFDGLLFDTAEQAARHEKLTKIRRLLEKSEQWHTSSGDSYIQNAIRAEAILDKREELIALLSE